MKSLSVSFSSIIRLMTVLVVCSGPLQIKPWADPSNPTAFILPHPVNFYEHPHLIELVLEDLAEEAEIQDLLHLSVYNLNTTCEDKPLFFTNLGDLIVSDQSGEPASWLAGNYWGTGGSSHIIYVTDEETKRITPLFFDTIGGIFGAIDIHDPLGCPDLILEAKVEDPKTGVFGWHRLRLKMDQGLYSLENAEIE